MAGKKTPAKKPAVKKPTAAEQLAVLFHDKYEELAPKFGYETRPDTKTFDPKTPNGKLMVAVAKEVLKQQKATAPKPRKPKPPTITHTMFKEWFYKQPMEVFIFLTQEWNDRNLEIKIPTHDDYDEWLNYFKRLSPRIVQTLAKTGVDFLPTDGYAALSRWHDIVKNPHRIDKIHQAGLTRTPQGGKKQKSIVELSQSNDRVGVLKAVRDEIAMKLQKGAGARDTAALSKELTLVMAQISDIEKRQGKSSGTKLGSLIAEVDLRKRPGKNGGGARNTSYKSKAQRVTIEDVEGLE
jgi:hypothetical protein